MNKQQRIEKAYELAGDHISEACTQIAKTGNKVMYNKLCELLIEANNNC